MGKEKREEKEKKGGNVRGRTGRERECGRRKESRGHPSWGGLLPDAGVDGRPCPTVHPLISADLVTAAR